MFFFHPAASIGYPFAPDIINTPEEYWDCKLQSEVLNAFWQPPWREKFNGETLHAALEMTVELVEICLDVELHYGTRVMLKDKPYLVPELQRVMLFREGVPVEGIRAQR